MTIETYLAYLATVLVFFAHPPGPSQFLFIAHSMQRGVRASFPVMAGDLSANTMQIVIAGFGLAGLVVASADLFLALKWAGVLYLIWLGVRSMLAKPAGHQSAVPVPKRNLFRQGFITSAANPYAVIFFAALFPQFLDPSTNLPIQILILGTTYLVVDGVILILMGAASTALLKLLRGKIERWINRISGAFMVLAAVLLAMVDLEPAKEKVAK